MEGGRPYSAVSKECPCKKVENSFMQSTDNVDLHELEILQREKFELEQQLKGKKEIIIQHSVLLTCIYYF